MFAWNSFMISTYIIYLKYKLPSSKPYVRLSLPRTVEVTSESIKKSGLTVGKLFVFKIFFRYMSFL